MERDASYNSTCALDSGGRIQCWGMGFTSDGDSPPVSCGNGATLLCAPSPRPVFGGRQYVAMAALSTGRGICGLTAGGEVDCWESHNAAPNPIQTPEPIVSLTHGCGMSARSVVYCWDSATGTVAKFR